MKSTLIPWKMTRVNEQRRLIEVSADKETVKNAPTFNNGEITLELEERVYSHFDLQRTGGFTDRGGYGTYHGDQERTGHSATAAGVTSTEQGGGEAGPGMTMGDREAGGEFRPHDPGQEGSGGPESDLEDTDELIIQRTEEELRAGTREHEAGSVNVHKRVRTDREQLRVSTRHEEVSVERVPVEERRYAAPGEIGEDEIVLPMTEE